MKKKLVMVLLTTTLILSACGNDAGQGLQQSHPSPSASTNTTNTPSSEENFETLPADETETSQPELPSESTLADIEKYMLDNGALSGNRTQMAADMVGAIDGFKYSDSGVEIYEYNINSEEYIALSNGEAIELNGMSGFTVECVSVNGKFVLFGEPSEDAIKCFNDFK